MKVKVIRVRQERQSHYPEPEAIENALQDWLNDNPDASIEHVAQTPIVSGQWVYTEAVYVTIFYRE